MTRNSLMTYLIINYPNPEIFQECLRQTLDLNPDFLEIQVPFSHPLADGAVIRQADKVAIKYDQAIEKSLREIDLIRKEFPNCTTKFVLMSYLSRLYSEGMLQIAKILHDFKYYGLVSPDLLFGSPEQKFLSQFWNDMDPVLIPLISPITIKQRIQEIIKSLKPNQLVYPTARIGITGTLTDFNNPDLRQYLTKLQKNFHDFKVAIGFGIQNTEQVKIVNSYGFTAIVATSLIKVINTALENGQNPSLSLSKKIKELLD